jgi:hypothetical protein
MALSGDAAKALEAVKNGKDPMAELYGETSIADDDSVIYESDVQPLDSNSTLDSLIGEDDQSSDLSPTTDQEAPTDESNVSESVETITVMDDKGRRKIKINFEDRDQIKKYAQMAHGARKWQAERDQAQSKLKKFEGIDPDQAREVLDHWTSIEEAYQSNGIEGLVNLIEGRDDAFKEFEKKYQSRWEQRRGASDEELEALDARERIERMERELIRERQLRSKDEEKRKQDLEAAEIASLQAQVNPVFDKYRFAGKLDDADAEADLDELLWDSVLTKLEPFEEQGIKITRDMIEREFKNKSASLRKHIKVQAEKRVKKTIAQKKQEATENAQSQAMRGIRGSSTAKEARDLLESPGGLTKVLQGWGKYGSVFKK